MLREQLQKLFPDHKEEVLPEEPSSNIWLQDEPLLCKYEKRNGKPVTLIEDIQVPMLISRYWLRSLKLT